MGKRRMFNLYLPNYELFKKMIPDFLEAILFFFLKSFIKELAVTAFIKVMLFGASRNQ
jgi:hypothetical protein